MDTVMARLKSLDDSHSEVHIQNLVKYVYYKVFNDRLTQVEGTYQIEIIL